VSDAATPYWTLQLIPLVFLGIATLSSGLRSGSEDAYVNVAVEIVGWAAVATESQSGEE